MATMVTVDTSERAVRLLKALGHPIRLQIANLLINGECKVGYLERVLGTTQTQVSQQLSILKLAGVLKSRRDGNKVYYLLTTNGIKSIVKSIIASI